MDGVDVSVQGGVSCNSGNDLSPDMLRQLKFPFTQKCTSDNMVNALEPYRCKLIAKTSNIHGCGVPFQPLRLVSQQSLTN